LVWATLNFGYLGISRLKWNWDDYIVIQYGREMTWTFTYSTSQVQESTARENSTPASHKHTLGFLMGDWAADDWLGVICGQLSLKKMIYCK
jgi:hypothetical protein